MAAVEVSPPTTIEVADALFCLHFKEVCDECNFDGREDNDGFFGFDHTDRDPLECPPATLTKDGVYQCKKHGSAECRQCYGWKKQITRAKAAARKAGRK